MKPLHCQSVMYFSECYGIFHQDFMAAESKSCKNKVGYYEAGYEDLLTVYRSISQPYGPERPCVEKETYQRQTDNEVIPFQLRLAQTARDQSQDHCEMSNHERNSEDRSQLRYMGVINMILLILDLSKLFCGSHEGS